jgi:hypothetical protein
VKRSNETAVSRTLEFQNPNAVCRIASGVGDGVLIEVRCSIEAIALPMPPGRLATLPARSRFRRLIARLITLITAPT